MQGWPHPLCGCVAVAVHEQCERDAQLVQLLIDLRPKLLASDAFSTTPPPARRAGSDAVSVLSRTTRPHLL